MEVFFQELAKLLNVTVEKATELYPVIREQYIWYKACGLVLDIFIISLALALAGLLVVSIATFVQESWKYKDEWIIMKRVIKYLLISSIAILTLTIIFSILQIIFAPDLMFMKELIK